MEMKQHLSRNEQSKIETYYLFVNSKSGGGWGKQYLTLSGNQITFQFNKSIVEPNLNEKFNIEQQYLVKVQIYDLCKNEDVLNGMNKVKANVENSNSDDLIRIIICGGDGTVLWVIKEAIKANINLERIQFGIIPIGTGNDFSRTLGWGGTPPSFTFGSLKQLKTTIQKWRKAKVGYYDIWDITLQTNMQGKIYQVQNKSEQLLNTQKLSTSFSNYFGIGIDARVSYKMQTHRTNSVFLNLIVYGCVGFCNLFKPLSQLNDVIDQFSESDNEDNLQHSKFQLLSERQSLQKQLQKRQRTIIIQNSSNKTYIVDKQKRLDSGYKCLVCLNSLSYMAGSRKVWKTKKIACQQYKKNINFSQQKFDDGKIQFVGFKSELRLALEKLIRSGSKIAQGQGPFQIKIKNNKLNEQNFVQIDGQPFRIVGLNRILIEHSKYIPGGKIRVLLNN